MDVTLISIYHDLSTLYMILHTQIMSHICIDSNSNLATCYFNIILKAIGSAIGSAIGPWSFPHAIRPGCVWLLQDEHSEYLDLPKTVSGALIGAQGTLKLGNPLGIPAGGFFHVETSTVRMFLGHCEGWKFEVWEMVLLHIFRTHFFTKNTEEDESSI